MNGRKSHKFEIGSGVLAQGCPLSPLLFLFIGEPLTRLVLEERELKGVKIGEHEHKVGQFADDTAAMLKGYEQLCHAQTTSTLLIFVAIACNFHEAPLLPFFLYRSTPKFLPLYLT